MKCLAAVLSCACLSLAHAGARSTPNVVPMGAKFVAGDLPLSFEMNRGQTDPRVDFLARGSGYTLFLSSNFATFALLRGTDGGGPAGEESVIRMEVLGAEPNVRMQPEDPLPGIANYLRSSSTASNLTGLRTYARTRVSHVYPDIDLVYYGTRGRLEYDFVVGAAADVAQIRLKFTGADAAIARNGDLVLSQGGDSKRAVRFQRPLVYQDIQGRRRPVRGRFVLASNNTLGFHVGGYDHRYPLTIDPVLAYSSYLGGSSQQSVPGGMALNAAGQIYVTGITNAVDYPTTTGVISPACPAPMTGSTKCGVSSQSSAFVSKIAADGQSLIYSTYLGGAGAGPGVGGSAVSAGGSGADYGVGIAVDANDEAWVVGVTNSNNFPITSDALQVYCSPVAADFNFNTNVYEGKKSDCAAYNNGGEYIYGAQSAFIVKLNPAGTQVLYGTFLGGSQTNLPRAIALDSAGNVYVAGQTSSAGNGPFASGGTFDFPTTTSGFQTTGPTGISQVGFVGFLSELSADGHSLLYSTLFTGSLNSTVVTGVAVSGVGKAAIGGYTQSVSLPVSAGAVQATCPTNGTTHCGGNVGFVAAFDTTKAGTASRIFSTYLSGQTPATADNYVSAIATDSAGNIYVTGPDSQYDYPTTAGALQTSCSHTNNANSCQGAFVTKLTPAGQITWSTLYTSPSDGGQSNPPVLALDSHNNVYISALDDGGGDIPLKNPFQVYQSGFAYITELSSDGSQVLFGSYYGGGAAINPTGMAVDTAQNIYLVGYTGSSLPLVHALQSTNAGGFQEGFFAKIAAMAPSTTTLAIAPASTATGQSVTFTATVTGTAGSAVPTGSVSFTNASASLGSATVGTTGIATLTSTTLAAGSYSVVAHYSGDALYAPSVAAAQPLTVTAALPTVNLAANPTTLTLGQTSTLTWSSTNATACTASGGWTGTEATAGTATQTPGAVGTVSYALTCTGAGGSANAAAVVTVKAPAPTVNVTASPASLTAGQSTTLTWTSTNATACTASGSWSGAQSTTGSTTETPGAAGTVTYTLTCTGAGGSANAAASVTVAAKATAGKGGGGAFDLYGIAGLLGIGVLGALRLRKQGTR